MVFASAAAAVLAYLIPLAVVVLVRARRERTPWEVGLDLPFAVAVDLLGILLLSLVFRFETAVFVSRVAWLVIAGVLVPARWRSGARWPEALRAREITIVLGGAAAAVIACWPLSGRYFIWDSEWHTGLVSALAGQRQPFINGVSQNEVLRYHFGGDALAAVFKILSWQVLSSNRALAIAHDTMFAITAATVALLVLGTRTLRGWPVALAGMCVLLHGPLPVRQDVGPTFAGFVYHGFLNLSYRPHYALGVVLLVGALGSVLFRAWVPTASGSSSPAPVLLPTLTLLSITDETSAAFAGLALGTFWLVQPTIVARSPRHGLLILASLPVLMLLTNLLFHASLSPGSPVQKLTLSPTWRLGSLWGPPLELAAPNGTKTFLLDSLPLCAAWLALALHALRSLSRPAAAFGAATGVLFVAASMLALRVQINDNHQEVHRFYVPTFVLATLATVVCFGAMRPGSTERALAVLGVVLPVVGQLYWVIQVAPGWLAPWAASPDANKNVFVTNCRAATGATLGESPRPAYVLPSQYFRFVGCRPVFSTGGGFGIWATKILPSTESMAQLRGLDAELADRSQPLDVVCEANPPSHDPVCSRALKDARDCKREGTDFVRCQLSAAVRKELLQIR